MQHLNQSNDDPTGAIQASTELAQLILESRRRSGFSAQDVADYLDISAEQLIAYESGQLAIPMDKIYAIANCLNISPRDILEIELNATQPLVPEVNTED